MSTYTCNVLGEHVLKAKELGYHAYSANGVTAIGIRAENKIEARKKAAIFGKVAYVFL